MKKVAIFLTFILCISLLVSCLDIENTKKEKYKLTVIDNYGLLAGSLEEYYEAGTEIRVYVKFLSGPLAGIKVNGVESVGQDKKLDGDNGCEYYTFIMPSQDSVLYITLNGEIGNSQYFLPYYSETDPYSIVLYEDGTCVIDFTDDKKQDYTQNYYIENGKLYIDIETAPKFHVFYMTGNWLIFDPVESTANLWDTMASRGPVVYFKSGISIIEKLSVLTMVGRNLEGTPTIEKIYGPYKIGNRYNDKTDDMYAFIVNNINGDISWSDKILGTDYTFTYTEGREILVYIKGMLLSLNEAFDRGYITLDILAELYEDNHDCAIEHDYDEGVISNNEEGKEIILYTCSSCGATKSVDLPKDFSFSLTWSFDGRYDSATGYLANGYNYELGTKCEATLLLDHDELMNIYRIFYNGGLFEINDSFSVSDRVVMPSYNIKISYTVNGENIDLSIYEASYLSYSQWEIHSELGYAYYKVIEEFITSSEEYKSMPPNTNIYE